MSQSITWLGATYPEVDSIDLPKTGGGLATFHDVAGSQTFTQNGTYDVSALAEAVVNVAGGGGASNVVTGTFKGTTTGAAMDINLPYTGSGFPIAYIITPSEGSYKSGGDFRTLVQRYAVNTVTGVRNSFVSTGTYGLVMCGYKSNSSSADNHTVTGSTQASVFTDNAAAANAFSCARIRSATKMSVFIASTSYGFAANIEYTYYVIYSS